MPALTANGRPPALPADAVLSETDDAYVVRLVVPGFSVDDLDVEVVEHTVTIRGSRLRATLGAFSLHERLEERVELPCDADPDALLATYDGQQIALRASRYRDGGPPARKVAVKQEAGGTCP